MELVRALQAYEAVQDQIEENLGELDEISEELLDKAYTDVAENLDKAIIDYKVAIAERDQYKSLLKTWVEEKSKRLDGFKEFLSRVAKKYGPLKTPLSSLSITKRKNKKVLIWNFDHVMEFHPSVVTTQEEDNVRTVHLNKHMMKKLWDDNMDCRGFEVIEEEIEFPNIRLRGQNGISEK